MGAATARFKNVNVDNTERFSCYPGMTQRAPPPTCREALVRQAQLSEVPPRLPVVREVSDGARPGLQNSPRTPSLFYIENTSVHRKVCRRMVVPWHDAPRSHPE